MRQGNRLDQVLLQLQTPRDAAPHPSDLQRVRQARPKEIPPRG